MEIRLYPQATSPLTTDVFNLSFNKILNSVKRTRGIPYTEKLIGSNACDKAIQDAKKVTKVVSLIALSKGEIL